eukprot:6206725-Pleurochrysis_carterae.AAC.2
MRHLRRLLCICDIDAAYPQCSNPHPCSCSQRAFASSTFRIPRRRIGTALLALLSSLADTGRDVAKRRPHPAARTARTLRGKLITRQAIGVGKKTEPNACACGQSSASGACRTTGDSATSTQPAVVC